MIQHMAENIKKKTLHKNTQHTIEYIKKKEHNAFLIKNEVSSSAKIDLYKNLYYIYLHEKDLTSDEYLSFCLWFRL